MPAIAAAASKPAGAIVCMAAPFLVLALPVAFAVPEAGEPDDSVTVELACVAVTTTVAAIEDAETWL